MSLSKIRTVKQVIENSMIRIPSNYFVVTPRLRLHTHHVRPWCVSGNIAAYLSFADKGDFNRFLLSGPMLDLYRNAHLYLVHGKSWMNTFHEKFRGNTDECRDYSDIAEEYDSKAYETYSNEHKKAASLALADILRTGYHMVEQFFQVSVVERQLLTDTAITTFQGIKDQLPIYDAAEYKAPALGPLEDFGEDLLERYRRLYYCLQHIKYILLPSRWRDYHMDEAAFKLAWVPAIAIPNWMRRLQSESSQDSRNGADSDQDSQSVEDEELVEDGESVEDEEAEGDEESERDEESDQDSDSEQEDANTSTDGAESPNKDGKKAESVESEQEEKVFNWEWIKSRGQQQTMEKHLEVLNGEIISGTVLGLRNQALKLDIAYTDLEDDEGNRVNIYGKENDSFEEAQILFRTKDVAVMLRIEIIQGQAKREWSGADLDPRDFVVEGKRIHLTFNESFDLIVHYAPAQTNEGYVLERRGSFPLNEGGQSSKKRKGKDIELAKSGSNNKRRTKKRQAATKENYLCH